MTCFRNRLSKLSCDSPSFSVTVAKVLTSFLSLNLSEHKNPACAPMRWMATGLARLWLWLSPHSLSRPWFPVSVQSKFPTLPGAPPVHWGRSLCGHQVYMTSVLLNRGRCIDPCFCWCASANHPGVDDTPIIADCPKSVKVSGQHRLMPDCQASGGCISDFGVASFVTLRSDRPE
jgi:hypothetical protein